MSNHVQNRAEQRAARKMAAAEGTSYEKALRQLRAVRCGEDFFVSDDVLIRGPVKVEWEDLGEGWDGDWNPEDEADESLLRFSFYALLAGEWVAVNDTSYCTQTPVATTPEKRRRLLTALMDDLHSYVDGGRRQLIEAHGSEREAQENTIDLYPTASRPFENASWLSPKDIWS